MARITYLAPITDTKSVFFTAPEYRKIILLSEFTTTV